MWFNRAPLATLLILGPSLAFLPCDAVRATAQAVQQLLRPWEQTTSHTCRATNPSLPHQERGLHKHFGLETRAWGFNMAVLLTASPLTWNWTSVFVTPKAGSIWCLISPLNLSSSSLIRFPATCPHFLFLQAILLWAPAGRHPSFKAAKL